MRCFEMAEKKTKNECIRKREGRRAQNLENVQREAGKGGDVLEKGEGEQSACRERGGGKLAGVSPNLVRTRLSKRPGCATRGTEAAGCEGRQRKSLGRQSRKKAAGGGKAA